MPSIKLITVVLALFFAFPELVLTHGGGLDSLGCHHNRKLGGYHCHRGELAGRSFASKADALNALEKQRSASKKSESQQEQQAASPSAEENDQRTVYVTATGKKYHGPDCSYLRKSKTAISLKEAKKQGHTACSRCNGK